MKNVLRALVPALLLASAAAPVFAQPAAAQDRGDHRGDHRGDRGDHRGDRGDNRDRGGWDRGDHRGNRGGGDWNRGRRHDDDIGGAIIGGVIGGLLGGSTYNYRFQYDDDYYGRRGYSRGQYDGWRNRDRGMGGCSAVGYGRGCRTIYYDRDFAILNIRGEVYCYRRSYGGWRAAYCPREWYNY